LNRRDNSTIHLCLSCFKADCDGTIDNLCPIATTAKERKKQALQAKIKIYTAIQKQLDSNGPMTTREIIQQYEITRSKINSAIHTGVLEVKRVDEIKKEVRGKLSYWVVGVNFEKMIKV